MQIYEIPRNYKGEGRILYIFSYKALIYSTIGAVIGLVLYFIFKFVGLSTLGLIFIGVFGLIGFVLGTFKIPESNSFEITKKVGGENIDDIIVRWIKFKKNNNKIYVYKEEEETKDE